MNGFDYYDTYNLGLWMVSFQNELDRCTPEQPHKRKYCENVIKSIARELLNRYRQESELLNRCTA